MEKLLVMNFVMILHVASSFTTCIITLVSVSVKGITDLSSRVLCWIYRFVNYSFILKNVQVLL